MGYFFFCSITLVVPSGPVYLCPGRDESFHQTYFKFHLSAISVTLIESPYLATGYYQCDTDTMTHVLASVSVWRVSGPQPTHAHCAGIHAPGLAGKLLTKVICTYHFALMFMFYWHMGSLCCHGGLNWKSVWVGWGRGWGGCHCQCHDSLVHLGSMTVLTH